MPVVIIPAYKPDETLAAITDQLWTYGCRIVVVDDGSGEEYQPVFDRVQDVCVILRHSENRGKGAAIKTALSYIKEEMRECSLIGVMDCDGQHLTEDMMKLFEYAGTQESAMVLGVREVGKDMPPKSRLGNQITKAVFRLASGVKVSDTQTGLRAFRSELLQRLLSIEGERYEYEMNVLMALAKAGIVIEEVPIHTIYRDEKNSNSHFRVVWDSLRIYKDILKFTASSFSSFLLDYLLFSALMIFLPHTAALVLAANVAARVVSAFYNYCMNCRFVFHTQKKAGTAVRYFGLAGVILFLNNLILEILVQFLGISVYPAKLLTECFLFLFSWLVQKCIIFRKETSGDNVIHALTGGKAEG
ncbi:MAG: bifunctional glycosyltransferase family 2/GtrA family protein [Eubacteriales bacterium]|nr:bifunctional glycosyltransferase family 2/GtrA family protein [Eubacteriales bacterium]